MLALLRCAMLCKWLVPLVAIGSGPQTGHVVKFSARGGDLQIMTSSLHRCWRHFDRSLMQPLFGGRLCSTGSRFASVDVFNQHSAAEAERSGADAQAFVRAMPAGGGEYGPISARESAPLQLSSNAFFATVRSELDSMSGSSEGADCAPLYCKLLPSAEPHQHMPT